MGRTNRKYLNSIRVFGCAKCKTHLAVIEHMMSRQFTGQHGRAFLFADVVNTSEGPSEERTMTTGLHIVRDLYCAKCDTTLGWKYDKAFEPQQKYKEGKYILEKALLVEVAPPSETVETEEGEQASVTA